MTNKKVQPVILIIMDGFGHGKKYEGNAVEKAKTPQLDQLNNKYPHTLLKASGHAVGVPKGVMGASEPGHVTLGAGRIIWQPLEEINVSIKDKSFFTKKELLKAINHSKQQNSNLHLIGMLSDGGIHSHEKHLYALLKLAKQHQLKQVYIHTIADGRDVPEQSINIFLKKIETVLKKLKIGQICSVIGRFYAMDRDNNWNRTKISYDLMTTGQGKISSNFTKDIKQHYKTAKNRENSDYYLPPIVSKNNFTAIKNKDAIIFFNFRSDRAKQLTSAFVDPNFKEFKTKIKPFFVCMGPYSKQAPIVFPPPKIKNNLGEILSQQKLKQLRIAETEKYAHVTFFFNSQIDKPFIGEDRIMIKSPKVNSYAEKPEMSAIKVTSTLIKAIKTKKYDFIILNLANPDLVGHSGDFNATVKACETVDTCIGNIVDIAQNNNYELIITADHGNAEEMFYYGTKNICPAHTTNPVNCIIVSTRFSKLKKRQGLQNIAPTILQMMNIKKPADMTGESLIIS